MTDVGIVFQDHLLLDFRTALDNVLLQGRIRRLDLREVRSRAEQLLEQLGVAAMPPTGIRSSSRGACASACRLRARWSTSPPCS